MITLPLFISGTEIAFIIFIVIMVFGADKVPEIARGLGKGMRTLKDATNDIKTEITKSAEKQGIDIDVKFLIGIKSFFYTLTDLVLGIGIISG